MPRVPGIHHRGGGGGCQDERHVQVCRKSRGRLSQGQLEPNRAGVFKSWKSVFRDSSDDSLTDSWP